VYSEVASIERSENAGCQKHSTQLARKRGSGAGEHATSDEIIFAGFRLISLPPSPLLAIGWFRGKRAIILDSAAA
jgi:hypothetical protein